MRERAFSRVRVRFLRAMAVLALLGPAACTSGSAAARGNVWYVRTSGPAPTIAVRTLTGGAVAASDAAGMRLSGVRDGSPAMVAGLKAGDVVIELAGVPVKDIYSYSDALYSHKPGDVVKMVVMRGAQRVEVSVTLGKRGG